MDLIYDEFRVAKFFIATKRYYKTFSRKYGDDYQAFLADLYDYQRLGLKGPMFGMKVYMVIAGKKVSVDRVRVECNNYWHDEKPDYYSMHNEPIDLVRVGYTAWLRVRDTMK